MKDRWQKLEEIFFAAADVSGSERDELISERSGDDLELRSEIYALLREHEKPSNSLDTPVFDMGLQVLDSAPGKRSGQTLGRFQIGRLIGRGGMGEIYEAEDTADGRHVAVKLLGEGFSRGFVRRQRPFRAFRIPTSRNRMSCMRPKANR